MCKEERILLCRFFRRDDERGSGYAGLCDGNNCAIDCGGLSTLCAFPELFVLLDTTKEEPCEDTDEK